MLIYDEDYPKAQNVEVVLRLGLRMSPRTQGTWRGCFRRGAYRIITCQGLGTRELYVEVGFNAFATGLQPRKAWYLALGDSYSAGTGTTGSTDRPPCFQTRAAYPSLAADHLQRTLPNFTGFAFTACNGADSHQLAASQFALRPIGVPAVQPPSLVTVTIGGNDRIGRTSPDSELVGFSGMLRDCIVRLPGLFCNPRLDAGAAQAALTRAYTAIKNAAGPKTVGVVMLYPQVLPAAASVTCPGGFNTVEVQAVRAVWSEFNTLIRQSARAEGFLVVEAENAFQGHEICSDDAWAQDLGLDRPASFHPNDAGHARMFELLRPILQRSDVLAKLRAP